MWLLKNLIWLVLMILIVGFCILNLNESVSAINLPGRVYRGLSLNGVLFVTFVLGMITAFTLTLLHHIRVRSEMRKLHRVNEDLKRELSLLRNLPLEDLATEGGGKGRP